MPFNLNMLYIFIEKDEKADMRLKDFLASIPTFADFTDEQLIQLG
jgi:hypothetical protein